MRLPEGRLVKSRVVDDPRDPLAAALDRSVTGYAVFEPQETLLLEDGGRGVVTFREGVPILAYFTGTDRGGPAALADLATPGPYRVELYELPESALEALEEPASLRVPPGMAAERLAGDPALAASTRRAAPDRNARCRSSDESTGVPDDENPDVADADREPGAVEAFLEDEEKIDAIQEQARREAAARAEKWGF